MFNNVDSFNEWTDDETKCKSSSWMMIDDRRLNVRNVHVNVGMTWSARTNEASVFLWLLLTRINCKGQPLWSRSGGTIEPLPSANLVLASD